MLFPKIFSSERLGALRSGCNIRAKSYNDTQDSILFFAGNGYSSYSFANDFKGDRYRREVDRSRIWMSDSMVYELLRKANELDEKCCYNLYAVDMPLVGDDFSAQGDINVKYKKVLKIAAQSDKRIIFVAHSMGGGIALKVAEKLKKENLEIFERIIVLNYQSFSSLSKAAFYLIKENLFRINNKLPLLLNFLFAALVALLFMYFTSFGFVYPFLIASVAFFVLDYFFDYVEYLVIKPLLKYSDSNLDVVDIAKDMLDSNQLRIIASSNDNIIPFASSLACEFRGHKAVTILSGGFHNRPSADEVFECLNRIDEKSIDDDSLVNSV